MHSIQPYVLVVDDNLESADSMAEMVGLWGYEAEAMYSGLSALAAVRIRAPFAVLLDIGMDLMDGFAFAVELRKLSGCEHTAVVAISGHTASEYQIRCCELGVGHYFFKPFDPELLHKLLQQLLEESTSPAPRLGLPRRDVGLHPSEECTRDTCDFLRKVGAAGRWRLKGPI